MNEATMSFPEKIALANLNRRINAIPLNRPRVAIKHYTFAEDIPDNVLTPEHIRALIRYELAALPRAFQLEQHAVERIQICGVPFLDWEASPELVTRRAGDEDDVGGVQLQRSSLAAIIGAVWKQPEEPNAEA